jgi:Mg2+ and Co2+ transporter CorA
MTNVKKEAVFQMFEEIKESLEQIDKRLDRLEKQVFEDNEHSFRTGLKMNIVGMNHSYSEFQKAQRQIVEILREIQASQNVKWWKRILQ